MSRILLALTAIFFAGFAATPVLAWAPTPQVEQGLLRGGAWAEVLPDTDGAGMIHAAIDIAAPPRTVWAVMTDCALARRMIANLVSCKVVGGDQKSGWDVREQITRGNLFIPSIRNVVRADYQPYSLIRFRRVGGDLKAEEGEWRLEPLDGGAGTRVIYVNRVAVNFAAPASLVRAGLKHDTPKVLMSLRRESLAAARS